MRFILFGLLLQALSAAANVDTVYVIHKRAVTYAATCTYFNTVILLSTTLLSTTCSSPAVSGPLVITQCYGGLVLGGCVAPSTVTSCSNTLTTTSTVIVAGFPVATNTITSSTCSNAVFPPAPPTPTPVAGSSCYADNVGGVRAMNGPVTSSNTMTNAICQAFCTNQRYAYSGTEYGAECYCSNTLPTTTSTSCNMACAAPGSLEICGGSNALSVLTNTGLVAANNAGAAQLASWTSRGCYGDNYPTRVLAAASATASTMSLESCVSLCDTGGYTLAGVEYANECYCANSILTDGSTYGVSGKSGCTYPCVGKPSQICGGASVLNLYSKGAVTSNNPSLQPFSPVPAAAGGYTLQGCYQDIPGSRTLTVDKTPINSVDACVAACSAAGFKYAGVEFRNECWCDNVIHNSQVTIDPTRCNMQCTGTPAQNCGGSRAVQIYMGTAGPGVTIPQNPVPGYTYDTTYTDSRNARVLPNQITLTTVTVPNCVTSCSNSGYSLAGLEFGSECFCGNTLLNNPTGGQTPNMVCKGNSAQFCGGRGMLQVYTGTPSPQFLTAPFTNNRCVIGTTNNARTLPVNGPVNGDMTPSVCRTACAGFTYYGVEYGNECYCGNTFQSGTVYSNSCNMPCAGDSAQLCGGPNALSIYNV